MAETIKAVTAVDRIAASFSVKNASTDLLFEGYYLESVGSKGTVRLYRDADDLMITRTFT